MTSQKELLSMGSRFLSFWLFVAIFFSLHITEYEILSFYDKTWQFASTEAGAVMECGLRTEPTSNLHAKTARLFRLPLLRIRLRWPTEVAAKQNRKTNHGTVVKCIKIADNEKTHLYDKLSLICRVFNYDDWRDNSKKILSYELGFEISSLLWREGIARFPHEPQKAWLYT